MRGVCFTRLRSGEGKRSIFTPAVSSQARHRARENERERVGDEKEDYWVVGMKPREKKMPGHKNCRSLNLPICRKRSRNRGLKDSQTVIFFYNMSGGD
ncbi:unnamed protein product [Protopolystoma xenopodis]|uniref:Uncharacterized protein n=1 Tax=Protopolystoma xenopodis TaxID=117903 RepID=A0A3S5B4P2_9PLAT|nr:unnamed protein product [Protopolystoma xenopodis]